MGVLPFLCRPRIRAGLGLLLGGLAACGQAPKVEAPGSLSVERLYPLRPGSVWTYDVDTGEGLPVLAITRVLARHEDRVEVSSGGEPLTYELRADGLYRSDLASYVLHTPIQKGTRWQGRDGAQVEITDVQKTVVAPAGNFSGCVEVSESDGSSQKRVRTVFCPDVGPVEIESSLQMALSGQSARVVARLRGYDFSGALEDAASQPAK
jgi:hypothetical protein